MTINNIKQMNINNQKELVNKIISIKKSKNIFIDSDGVIVDSNKFKERSIRNSIFDIVRDPKYSEKAIRYFNEYAGVGRKEKLEKFFDQVTVKKILDTQ